MSDAVALIRTRKLCKDFARDDGQHTAAAYLRRLVTGRNGADAANSRILHALEDITFEVGRGELVGIVGNNGAGKTTLLKVIAGIYAPTRGSLERNGRLVLLSGLGVGMVPDLTVRENVYLYGAICRLSRERIEALFHEILDWAELAEFTGAPLRNLSTGMHSRLAFSIARHIDTPIILMDEAMTAGDERFKLRCEDYFEARRTSGAVAMLIATHSLELVERFCAKTLWLRYGEQVAFGATTEILPKYREWAAGGA